MLKIHFWKIQHDSLNLQYRDEIICQTNRDLSQQEQKKHYQYVNDTSSSPEVFDSNISFNLIFGGFL